MKYIITQEQIDFLCDPANHSVDRKDLLSELKPITPMTDEEIFNCIRQFYQSDTACKMSLDIMKDEFQAIERHITGELK
jgi:hypothetical protein